MFYTEVVGGSNPSPPTNVFKDLIELKNMVKNYRIPIGNRTNRFPSKSPFQPKSTLL